MNQVNSVQKAQKIIESSEQGIKCSKVPLYDVSYYSENMIFGFIQRVDISQHLLGLPSGGKEETEEYN